MIKVLEHLSYEERLKKLGEVINVYKYLQEECKQDGAKLFSVVPSDTGRGN